MAKKNFTGGIDSLFHYSKIDKKIETTEKNINRTISYSRTTIIVNNDTYEKIKAIAYWERKPIKEIVELGFNAVLSLYPIEEQDKMIREFKNRI